MLITFILTLALQYASTIILTFALQYASTMNQYTYYVDLALIVMILFYVAQIIWGIFVMSRYLKQHNTVNKIYNLNTFGQKA